MTRLPWIELTLLFSIVTGARCLRDTRLEIQPEIVEQGSETTLRCHYDLEKEKLYTLKWYRGTHEFYRFMPGAKKPIKFFELEGIDIEWSKSDEKQVTIKNVGYNATGNYSCEVTTDGEFTTEAGHNRIVVVSLPRGRPVIVSEKERYELGETLKANCTVPTSKPRATLSFTLNNKPVGQMSPNQQTQKQHKSNRGNNEGSKVGPGSYNGHQQQQPDDGLQWNELSLTLMPYHYLNGQLTLRCIVLIPGIYNETVEIQLGTGLREPVPERVTSENAGAVHSVVSLTLLSLAIVQPLLR